MRFQWWIRGPEHKGSRVTARYDEANAMNNEPPPFVGSLRETSFPNHSAKGTTELSEATNIPGLHKV